LAQNLWLTNSKHILNLCIKKQFSFLFVLQTSSALDGELQSVVQMGFKADWSSAHGAIKVKYLFNSYISLHHMVQHLKFVTLETRSAASLKPF
jgi:hypothetical protein